MPESHYVELVDYRLVSFFLICELLHLHLFEQPKGVLKDEFCEDLFSIFDFSYDLPELIEHVNILLLIPLV